MIAPERCDPAGHVIELLGPVVRARLSSPMALGDVGFLGDARLIAEVVSIAADVATLQVYENIAGMAAGAPVFACGSPLSAELGPGLLGSIFDGLQRPLPVLAEADGHVLRRGRHPASLDRGRRWRFVPAIAAGSGVAPGETIGTIDGRPLVHRVLVPPGVSGRAAEVAAAGDYTVTDTLAIIETALGPARVSALTTWPVRQARPSGPRLPLHVPLITGQRVLDTLFPVALGGTVGMPGGFGTGKTVMQQQLCKWAEADVIVFVGCGERGNEMAEVLSVLPALTDPRTGHPLSERTVLIANTSDMPVAAREASIYLGVTIAEYYRDMGYHALLLADSTSRWAEALREISGRLGEMPAEEGYPPYLASRIAAFYERAGRVATLAGGEGSVTIVGAVSPPGGDLTEPVTRHTGRHARCFWTLDKALAQARKFPAISLAGSYSERADQFGPWWLRTTGIDWQALRSEAMTLLEEADHLEQTARLIGTSNLPDRQQLILAFAAMFEEAFLRQAADGADQSCAPSRQVRLLRLLMEIVGQGCARADAGVPAREILGLPSLDAVRRIRAVPTAEGDARIDAIAAAFRAECDGLVPAGAEAR